MKDRQISALLAKASELRRAGRTEEAILAYEQLLEHSPDLPDSWYNLGWLQRQARRFDAALASYGRALALGISRPEEVHLNRAVILSDHLARPEAAEEELQQALALNPFYLPALLNLGNLYEDLGRRDEARAQYRQALEAEPGDALALARLAGVAPSVAAGDPLIDRLQQALRRPDLGPQDRADLGFALGRLLDSAGEFDAAFRTYEAANRASRDQLEAAGLPVYQPAQQEALVDRLIRAFAKPAPPAGPGQAPIFICGMFRSGSTLVEQILGAHSGVQAGGELDLIPTLVAGIDGYPETAAEADGALVQQWRDTYLAGLPPVHDLDRRLTDKRPDNFLHVGLIKTLFPGARIVHTRRNPIDNILSIYFLHLNPQMAYGLDLSDLAHWYGQYARLMAHWKSLYPDDIFDVDYDQLVREPKPIIRALLRFLDLPWTDGLLDFHRGSAPVKTASVWQVRQPLHARSSGRWRNYSEQLGPIISQIGS